IEDIDMTTYSWKKALAGVIKDDKDLCNVATLKEARNRLVHSRIINQKDLEYWIDISEAILRQLKKGD
ncbi:MAG: hypothetical protein Q8K51_08440, partial [Nitrospirota bacterium]|nr:hypothetical protein [Nitrospirota bacterium]